MNFSKLKFLKILFNFSLRHSHFTIFWTHIKNKCPRRLFHCSFLYVHVKKIKVAQQRATGIQEFYHKTVKNEWWHLTYGTPSNKCIFPRVDGFIIRPVSPHVCSTVYQPGGIKHHGIPQEPRNKVSHHQGLPPEVPGHHGWGKEAKDHHREFVVPVHKGTQILLVVSLKIHFKSKIFTSIISLFV